MKINITSVQEDFNIEIVEGIPIVKLNSMRLTLNEAKVFRQILNTLITANHFKVILDFTETRFLDSAITNVMLNVVKEVRKMKGDIVTVTPNGSICNIFVQTKLNRIFKQYNTAYQALSGFSEV